MRYAFVFVTVNIGLVLGLMTIVALQVFVDGIIASGFGILVTVLFVGAVVETVWKDGD